MTEKNKVDSELKEAPTAETSDKRAKPSGSKAPSVKKFGPKKKPAAKRSTTKKKTSTTKKSKANTELDEAAAVDEAGRPVSEKVEAGHLIVGIGASAGGLEAMKELIAGLPQEGRISYVIAQHLSPKHKSLLIELLSKGTDLAVVELTGEQEPKPSTIYVTPSRNDVEYSNGMLRLVAPSEGVGPNPSVDHLFYSLAANVGRRAVALVLSGTGSDGAAGVRAVRAAGGVVLAQTPESAKFDGMPRAAIQTQCVDIVKEPSEMGEVLQGYISSNLEGVLPADVTLNVSDLKRIFTLVRRASGMDLNNYKAGTVTRRLQRRMAFRQIESEAAYADYCQANREEAQQLARDVIISVTGFFRDTEAFATLETAINKIVVSKNVGEVVRVWVAGCATGEEAYSIAILLTEALNKRNAPLDFLIFASDIDVKGVERARHGVYSAKAVEDVPELYLNRYFERVGNNYQVRQTLRQNIVFASQDVISDPPFSRLDLVSCRNMLIYFNRSVQERVMKIFHYALEENGLLFLGKSEVAEMDTPIYSAVSQTDRLYKKLEPPAGAYYDLGSVKPRAIDVLPDTAEARLPVRGLSSREQHLNAALVRTACPPGIVIDGGDRVMNFVGDVSRYIRFPSGVANLNLFDLLPDQYRADVRAMIFRCRREQSATEGGSYRLKAGEAPVGIKLAPVEVADQPLIFISFVEMPEGTHVVQQPVEGNHESAVIGALEGELANTRLHLQTVVEELETSNEELQSQSEELQSANEELQSANEELQTSNEELQSTNEELITVNEELQSKSQALEQSSSTILSISDSLPWPMLVVSKELKVLQSNEASSCLSSNGKNIDGLALHAVEWGFNAEEMLNLVHRVLRGRVREDVQIENGDLVYVLSVTPNLDSNGHLLGVVLCFYDITDLEQSRARATAALDRVREERERYSVTLDSISDGVIAVDVTGGVEYMNGRAEQLTGWNMREVGGVSIEKIYRVNTAKKSDAKQHIFTQVLRTGLPAHRSGAQVICHNSSDSSPRVVVEESVSPIYSSHDALSGAVLVFRDVSDQNAQRVQLEYQAAHDSLTGLLNREAFERDVNDAERDVQRGGDKYVLGYLDLDKFKLVNDQAGHSRGDLVLKQIAVLLRSQLRAADTLARVGGDEFAFLLKGCDMNAAKDASHKLVRALAGYSFEHEGVVFDIGASIGLVELTETCSTFDMILKVADLASYKAKQQGGGCFEIGHLEDVVVRQREADLELIREVEAACKSDRILLHVQDGFSAYGKEKKQSIVYREVLARLEKSDGSVILPSDFVRIGETYKLMRKVDLAIVTKALNSMQELQLVDNSVWAINVSGDSISSVEFQQDFYQVLEESGADPKRLCIEITETAAIKHMAEATRFINNLRRQGVKFALDDFGSGMSSFGYLQSISADYLKIDGRFIKRMIASDIDRSMVEVMTRIGHDLDMKIIAEFVENREIALMCSSMGIDILQGFYLHKPESIERHLK